MRRRLRAPLFPDCALVIPHRLRADPALTIPQLQVLNDSENVQYRALSIGRYDSLRGPEYAKMDRTMPLSSLICHVLRNIVTGQPRRGTYSLQRSNTAQVATLPRKTRMRLGEATRSARAPVKTGHAYPCEPSWSAASNVRRMCRTTVSGYEATLYTPVRSAVYCPSHHITLTILPSSSG